MDDLSPEGAWNFDCRFVALCWVVANESKCSGPDEQVKAEGSRS